VAQIDSDGDKKVNTRRHEGGIFLIAGTFFKNGSWTLKLFGVDKKREKESKTFIIPTLWK